VSDIVPGFVLLVSDEITVFTWCGPANVFGPVNSTAVMRFR